MKIDDNFIGLVQALKSNGCSDDVFETIANFVMPRLKNAIERVYSPASSSFDTECGDYVIEFTDFQEFRDEFLSRKALDEHHDWYAHVIPKYKATADYVYDVTDEYNKYMVDLTALDLLDYVESK